MKPNRMGNAVEYKKGHHYLTVVEWEDGHCEIEVHYCAPAERIFHTCDRSEMQHAVNALNKAHILDGPGEPLILIARS
jgi:hypothetical protein